MPTSPGRFTQPAPATGKHETQLTINRWGRDRGGRPWRRTRERIFKRDNFLCQQCLREDRLTAVELHGARHGICDHIVNQAAGGEDVDGNLQALCQSCSKAKTEQEAARGRAG